MCATRASQVPAARRNPALGVATIRGAVSTDSVCAILDSPVQTAQRESVLTTVMSMAGV